MLSIDIHVCLIRLHVAEPHYIGGVIIVDCIIHGSIQPWVIVRFFGGHYEDGGGTPERLIIAVVSIMIFNELVIHFIGLIH
jgi:hypothetical protein